ncbi:hypothetical protein AN958_12144 [Leucoagaricus sp. SymC.cos]|nr:hypothetical protein AN958_12144 [Leucoagaricus sp. SymC.cos]
MSSTNSWSYPLINLRKDKLDPSTEDLQSRPPQAISRKARRRLMKETQNIKTEELKVTDKVIALMGPTGSGKSTFISTISGADQGIGHDLMSCTNEIKAMRVRVTREDEDIDVVLVDTPGFDDTYKSDYEILQMISEWIKQAGYKNILLDGLLYLHRISDNRMAGTPLRNLEVFEKICGPQACTRVAMVTTMWDDVESEEMGDMRERELVASFWKPMVDRGSKVVRYSNTPDSAWAILDPFLSHRKQEMAPIRMQKETVQQNKQLRNTDAGQELYNKLDEIDKKRRSLMKKLQKQIERSGSGGEIVEILQSQLAELEREHIAETDRTQWLGGRDRGNTAVAACGAGTRAW